MKKRTPTKDLFRFTSMLERSSNKLWGSHFRVPNHIAKRFTDGYSHRVVCTLNDSVTYQCALRAQRDDVFVIPVNKKLRDTLGLAFGMEVDVSLRKDESEYGLPLPEELHELLQQDPVGKRMFHALTRGKQRTLLYIVGSAKSSEKRITRAIAVVGHLKSNGGKINYKQLNALLKNPRR